MSEQPITCPICSYQFLPSEHPGCAKCPLHKKCVMICCPSCGYSIAIPEKSTLIKWISNLFQSKKSKENQG